MIEPFEPGQVKEVDGRRVVSYGTSSYGYDVRCADEFKLFTNVYSAIVDPKKFDDKSFVDMKGDHVVIPPNSFALARTVEYFRIPRNVMTICLGKSTYARCGIIVNVTPSTLNGKDSDAGISKPPDPSKIYARASPRFVLRGDEVCGFTNSRWKILASTGYAAKLYSVLPGILLVIGVVCDLRNHSHCVMISRRNSMTVANPCNSRGYFECLRCHPRSDSAAAWICID